MGLGTSKPAGLTRLSSACGACQSWSTVPDPDSSRCRGCGRATNELLLRVPDKPSCDWVVYFPGDVQSFDQEMADGPHPDLLQYSLDSTVAEHLATKFPSSVVVVCQATELRDGTFARYCNFVPSCDDTGSVPCFLPSGTASTHLTGLLGLVLAALRARDPAAFDVLALEDVSLDLLGFSRGGVVLTQLATELGFSIPTEPRAAGEDAAEKEAAASDSVRRKGALSGVASSPRPDSSPRSSFSGKAMRVAAPPSYENSVVETLFRQVRSLHWIDAGNGTIPGTFPVNNNSLHGLARVAPEVRLWLHASPYQLDNPQWDWVREELELFARTARGVGLDVLERYYFQDAPPSVNDHFSVLKGFATTAPPPPPKEPVLLAPPELTLPPPEPTS